MNRSLKVLGNRKSAATTSSESERTHPLLFGACTCGRSGASCLHCARWGAHFRSLMARVKSSAGGPL